MNIIWKGSPNFWKNRTLSGKKYSIKKIVIHWFGSGTLEGANTRFQNAANDTSAHYGISKGRVWQWVKETDAAWHSGNGIVNLESIGIEHDATEKIPNKHDLSEQDYKLSAQLLAEISKRHNLPLNTKTVIGHKSVVATKCPGTIDIAKLISMANQILNPSPPMPTQYTKKVLILLSNVAEPALTPFKAAVAKHIARAAAQTDNEFLYDISYFVTDAIFHTENVPGYPTPIFVNAMEIAVEARKAEVALSKEFDSVCLFYDPAFIVGPQPTNPVQNPMTFEGFNPFQIPTTWVGTSEDSARLFFAHEDSHSNYYIVNSEAGVALPDKTHDNPPQQFAQWGQEFEPPDFFIALLKELKPWWVNLTQGNASQENMTKYFRVNQAGKLGIMLLEGFSGTLVFENNYQEYLTLLSITGMNLQAPEIQIPVGTRFKINDHGKSGIVLVEGFTGSVLFENSWSDYQTLLTIAGVPSNAATINVP